MNDIQIFIIFKIILTSRVVIEFGIRIVKIIIVITRVSIMMVKFLCTVGFGKIGIPVNHLWFWKIIITDYILIIINIIIITNYYCYSIVNQQVSVVGFKY